MPHDIAVVIGYAQSLDGNVATSTGDSRWISGPESLEYAHTLRRDNDAILVGIGTVLRDDPLLTCRLPQARSPHRVVLDSQLRVPLNAQLVRTAAEVPTTVFTTHARLETEDDIVRRLRQAGVVLSPTRSDASGALDLSEVLRHLRASGRSSVFVEGGGRIITSFLSAQLVDELHLVIAPILIGGGVSAVGDLGVRSLADAFRFRTVATEPLGEDLLWKMTR